MPTIVVNGVNLYYEEQGAGPETILFAHGLLWSGRMFEQQVAALKDRYRCIRFDFRGQGRSEITQTGYDMDSLTEDAAALIEALDCKPCHFLGLSMGGFVGLRLAIRQPQLLKSLLLLNTTADPEPKENLGRFKRMNFIARWLGIRWVAGRVMPIMFGQKFLTDPGRVEERRHWHQSLLANHKIGTSRAVAGVYSRLGVADQLDRITVPTLIIAGEQDEATVPAKSERMQQRIQGSKLVVIKGAGHSSTIEEPQAVNRAVEDFLSSLD